jgi:hypothetical protein
MTHHISSYVKFLVASRQTWVLGQVPIARRTMRQAGKTSLRQGSRWFPFKHASKSLVTIKNKLAQRWIMLNLGAVHSLTTSKMIKTYMIISDDPKIRFPRTSRMSRHFWGVNRVNQRFRGALIVQGLPPGGNRGNVDPITWSHREPFKAMGGS